MPFFNSELIQGAFFILARLVRSGAWKFTTSKNFVFQSAHKTLGSSEAEKNRYFEGQISIGCPWLVVVMALTDSQKQPKYQMISVLKSNLVNTDTERAIESVRFNGVSV